MGLFIRKTRDGRVQVASDPDFVLGPPKKHHFSKRWVDKQIPQGLVTLSQDRLIIHRPQQEDLVYLVVRTPGSYCVHCGEKLADDPARTEEESLKRQQYVRSCRRNRQTGSGAGYEHINYYDAVLDEEPKGFLEKLFGGPR